MSFAEKLNDYLKQDDKTANYLGAPRAFGNTHMGLAILGIAGKELGLRAPDTYPSFDPNGVSASNFVNNPRLTKANILEAFTETFTFENICEVLDKELWSSLATASKLPLSQDQLFSR